MNKDYFDTITIKHIFDKNKFGQSISRTFADFLSKTFGTEIHVRLNYAGQKEYYWPRFSDLPLSQDEHVIKFMENI